MFCVHSILRKVYSCPDDIDIRLGPKLAYEYSCRVIIVETHIILFQLGVWSFQSLILAFR